MKRIHQKISDLIHHDPAHAKALHFLGIHFDHYSEDTLGEICEAKGFDPAWVVEKLNESTKPVSQEINLDDYPLDLVIEYLKHQHFIFIKDRLPYLAQLIEGIEPGEDDTMKELKFIFPEFMRDFIEHVYEEEDDLFAYIKTLNSAPLSLEQEKASPSKISHLEAQHHHQDKSLEVLIEWVKNANQTEATRLSYKVILEALGRFARELEQHALIENEILFPKAKKLEAEMVKPTAAIGD